MKILHIITGLNRGGAEMMLYKIIKHSPNPTKHRVVSLIAEGFFAQKIRELGCVVESLDMTKNPLTFSPFHILRIIKDARPDVIQCWMFHANIIGGFFGRLSGVKNIVWGIHHSMSKYDRRISHLINKIGALMSHNFCDTVICCGLRPLEVCKNSGYAADKLKCVYNGFEPDVFFFDENARKKIRTELGLTDDAFVVVHMARFHILKNHLGLLRIFAKLLAKNHNSYLVLVGDGLAGNEQIENAIDELGIRANVKMMGFRTDSCAFYSAADVTVLPSLSEGFPNVVGESMLCERPCITSAVGDCANITGHSDWAFEVSDEDGFAEKLFEFSKMPKSELKACGEECRKRIVDNFDIEKIYSEYSKIWCK